MKLLRVLFYIGLALLSAYDIPVIAAAAPPAKIVITPASFSEREGLLIVAQNQGFFRKRNLGVQLVLMPNAPIAFSALTGGESHFYYGTASGTSLGAVMNGLDGVFVAGFINKLVGAFAVGRDIKTPNDLKGKQIGVASLAGGNWMFTMLAFDHWGLNPKRDNSTFRVIGNTGVRAQSIASGIIAGSMLGYTFAANLKREGYPILADVAELNIPLQDTGLYTRKSIPRPASRSCREPAARPPRRHHLHSRTRQQECGVKEPGPVAASLQNGDRGLRVHAEDVHKAHLPDS